MRSGSTKLIFSREDKRGGHENSPRWCFVACGLRWLLALHLCHCINIALILPEGIGQFQLVIQKERKWLRLNLDASGRQVTFKLAIKQVWFRAQLVCCDIWAGLPARDRVQNIVLCLLWGKQASSNRLGVCVLFSHLSPRIQPKMHLRFCVPAIPVCVLWNAVLSDCV